VPAEGFRITSGVVNPTPITMTNFAIGFPGAQPSISSNGSDPNSAIMWALRVDNFGQKGPAELMAFKAEDLSQEIYSSNGTSLRDQFGSSVKFVYPIVSNGHVFAGSNGVLAVFGMFPMPAAAPAAPSNLTGTGLEGGTQIKLSWTNNFTTTSPATGNVIFRSPDGVVFQQIATVSRNATTFTDSGLTPATLYFYRVEATNQKGNSGPSNTATIRTRIAAPALTVADICVGEVDLSWTGTANNHYDVKRSTDGTNFTLIASVPSTQTTFSDTGLANGTYFYQVTASSTFPEGTDTGNSNIAKAVVGPITITHFVSAGNPGFTDHSDMVANGSAQFTSENLLRLNNNFSQAGSAFETQRVGIRGFTTSFQVRLHEGTQPNPADGFTFLIQANSPTALGGGGGSLGYQGIPNSVAIKFDVFDNEGETANSTGLFFGGGFPGLPHNLGEVNIALDPANVNLRSQSTKTITLTYTGNTLTETIHDPTPGQTNNGDFSKTYTVDIASKVGADTAFVGFSGGTGGLFSLQDILNWQYAEQERNLPPRAPANLKVTSITRHDANRDDVTLTWLCNNAYTATGFDVQRSTDGVNWTTVASLPVMTHTFTDQKVEPGAYFYRVESTNANGSSRPSNVVTAEIHVTAAPVNLQVLNLFSQHVQIGWDANSSLQSGFQVERSTDGVNFTAIATVGPYTTSYIDARFSAPVYYRVESVNGDGVPGLPSNVLKINSQGQFVAQDVGAVGFPGNTTFDQGSRAYSVTASGSDIWDVADSMQFVYKPLSGDGEIVARVVSIQNPDFWTKAGVMIRGDTSPGAPDAFMLETGPNFNHNEPIFQWRTNGGGGTSDSDNHFTPTTPFVPQPMWVRLDRVGNTFFGYWAVDTVNPQGVHVPGPWQNIGGPQTVNMPTNAFVGLALTAHNNGTTANAVFDNVTVTQTGVAALGTPTGLTVADIDPFKSQSSILVAWRPGSDNESGFKVERSTDGVNFTQIGTTAAGATTFTDTNPDGNGVADGTYYYRVKAFATGLADSGYSNVDSIKFVQPGSTLTIDHSGGFASHSDLTTGGSASIFPNPAPVGAFLGHQDIGGVAAPGSVTFDNSSGAYTVNSSSFDIWDVSDSFQYVYKPLTGDGEIDVRVVNVGPTDFWAKAGIMMRESLRANSRNAFTFETPNLNGFDHNEPVFQWRSDPGGFSSDSGNHVMHEPPAPIWLRLVRQGNNFSGYWALDNNGVRQGNWNQLGSTITINMASTIYVGLAVTGQGGNANTSIFDHLSFMGNVGTTLPPSVVELTDGGFGEAGGVFLNNRVGVQNFSTTFTFQITPGTSPMADGMAFVIQGAGPTALGGPGGGLGYGSDHVGGPLGIPRSLAIKFDLFDNSGEGVNSTGIFTDGRSPTIRDPGLGVGFPDNSVSLNGSGIDLSSGHPFKVTLTYDGTTLTETITDTVTSQSFTTSYDVNIPGLLGSDAGYMGFTGGTGGLTAIQDVLSWTIQTTLTGRGMPPEPQLAAGGPAVDAAAPALSEAELAPVAQQAVARWAAAGLDAAGLAKLNAVQYQIVTLSGGVLGVSSLGGNVVSLDATAAGYGWFVDPTSPDDTEFGALVGDAEYQAAAGNQAFGRMDLLTVVEHELGHVLGLADLDPQAVPHDLMTQTLATGVRRVATPSDVMMVAPTGSDSNAGLSAQTNASVTTGVTNDLPSGTDGGAVLTPTPTGAGDAALSGANGLGDSPSAPSGNASTGVFDPTLLTGMPLVVTSGSVAGVTTWNQLTVGTGATVSAPAAVGSVDAAFGASTATGDGLAAQTPGQRPSADVSALDRAFGSADLGSDLSGDLG
jgi:hypothetical protein